jgi:hypothetical protein
MGQTLTVADGIQLSVTNIAELNGDIRLEGGAQLLQTHSGTTEVLGSGNLIIDQTSATTNVYQSGYWTSPVTTNGSTFTIGGVMKDGTTSTPQDITFTDINTLDGDGTTTPITISGRWLARLSNALNFTPFLDPATETFTPGEGYNMKGTGGSDGSSTQNYSFVGIPNDGDYSLTIDDERLYLIGNPYPSALDANQFITDNSDAIGGTLYFYEAGAETSHASGDYTGGYATYNGVTGVPFNGGKTPGQYIPVAQAFFVLRDVGNSSGTGTPGSSATIDFNNNQRAFVLEGATSVFFSRQANNQNSHPILKLGMEFDVNSSQSYHRQVAIGFVGGTRDFENGLDSRMFGSEATDFGLTVNNETALFSIIGIESFSEDMDEIPFQVYADINRNLTFSVDSQTGLDQQKIYLNDYQEGIYYEIQDAPQQININAGTYADRFTVSFKIPEALSTDDELLKNLLIYYNSDSKEIIVQSGTRDIKSVKVFSILGQEIKAWTVKNDQSEFRYEIQGLKTGVYIVDVFSEQGKISKKIFIE